MLSLIATLLLVLPGILAPTPLATTALAATPLDDTAPETAADDTKAEILKRGRRFVAQFHGSQHEVLWESLSTDMKEAMGGQSVTLAAFKLQVDAQLGLEDELISEATNQRAGVQTYVRKAAHDKTDQLIDTSVQFQLDGTVIGFTISPEKVAAPSDYLDYETKTALSLPFDDAWTIVWGGRTIEQNYHVFTRDQRFAYDILVMRNGATHTGDGTELEQYYAFGKRVLAPGDGIVVSARDGVVDNLPGVMNPAEAMGNYAILDHGNGEYSFLAHLKQGTLAVSKGDEVKAGDLLGLCGNSGNTTEPHIHYHLQDTPRFNDGQGMPAPFMNYVADGEPVDRGEPVRLQVVERASQ